jgi:hypothetical protein
MSDFFLEMFRNRRKKFPCQGKINPPSKAVQLLRLTRCLGDEVAHLLLYFGGVALGAGNLAGFVILEAHDAHKLFAAFDADIFIGGHGSPHEEQV